MRKETTYSDVRADELSKRLALMSLIRDAEESRFLAKVNPRSAGLISYNAFRGMSRNAMYRIWGERLVRAVLG